MKTAMDAEKAHAGEHDYATRAIPELYEKCAECHLFVEPNEPTAHGAAAFVHLHRDDEADEELDGSHEARPSGQLATLDQWRKDGPPQMRARFHSVAHD